MDLPVWKTMAKAVGMLATTLTWCRRRLALLLPALILMAGVSPAAATPVNGHKSFLSNLSDSIDKGVSALVVPAAPKVQLPAPAATKSDEPTRFEQYKANGYR